MYLFNSRGVARIFQRGGGGGGLKHRDTIRFRHLNIVGCLLKRRPTKREARTPQDPLPPLATPLNSFTLASTAIFNFTQSLLPALTLILLHDLTTSLFSSALDPTLLSAIGIS